MGIDSDPSGGAQHFLGGSACFPPFEPLEPLELAGVVAWAQHFPGVSARFPPLSLPGLWLQFLDRNTLSDHDVVGTCVRRFGKHIIPHGAGRVLSELCYSEFELTFTPRYVGEGQTASPPFGDESGEGCLPGCLKANAE